MMWCGYEAFVDHVRALSTHLGNGIFFVGDEEDYIDEFRITAGELHYHSVHAGRWWSVKEFVQSNKLGELDA